MLAIFISTLFVPDQDTYAALRTSPWGEREQKLRAVNERICDTFPMLGALLSSVLSRDLIRANELGVLSRDLYRLLNEAGAEQVKNSETTHKLEQGSAHEAEERDRMLLEPDRIRL